MDIERNSRGVLLVDDEESIRFAVAQYLTAKGYAVEVASTRAEAERLFAARRHPAVVTDLQLTYAEPRGGLELIHNVLADAPSTTTILVTAYACQAVRDEASRAGCLVLDKPFPLSKLTHALATD